MSSSCRKPFFGVYEGRVSKVYSSLAREKEDRVAMLKTRFADTIQKARNGTLLAPVFSPKVKKDDRKTVVAKPGARGKKQDKFMEKVFIEAKRKSNQAAKRVRVQEQLKKLREEARKATQQIQRTVFLDENIQSMIDFEKLVEFPQSSTHHFYKSYKLEEKIAKLKSASKIK